MARLRYLMIACLALSFQLGLPNAQAISMLLYSTLIVLRDIDGVRFKLNRFDISTSYAILLILTTISHIIALNGWNDNHYFFAKIYSAEIAANAIFLFNIGSIIIIETMRKFIRKSVLNENELYSLQNVSFFSVFVISILIFIISQTFPALIHSLGSIGSFFVIMVNGSIFLLSFIAHKKKRHVILIFSYTLFLSIWAVQYAYLRMEIMIPWVSYLAGDFLASRSIKRLHGLSKITIVAGVIIFPALFTFLGNNRPNLYGREKLNKAIEAFSKDKDEEGETIMTRLSIIPQISNIIRLTEKKGFYEGKTLTYLGYVLIPRFIWPEKPLIKQGQWFALEIGAAYKRRNGIVNNSVNMTVPGEFYLNFGFIGVIIGCILFGLFIGWLWNQTDYTTIYGWAFRFYFIFLGLFSLGADLQIVPTLIAFLLIYKMLVYLNNAANRVNAA